MIQTSSNRVSTTDTALISARSGLSCPVPRTPAARSRAATLKRLCGYRRLGAALACQPAAMSREIADWRAAADEDDGVDGPCSPASRCH